MSTSVFVTGASGYIAQHIVKTLLSKGYSVVGTVRSAPKGDHLKTLFASERFTYEVVPDIKPVGAFDQALKNHPEVTVFLHTASPTPSAINNVEEELLKPAVEGTKNVLKAIKAHGPQIKHVVLTSSLGALVDLTRLKDPTYTFSEETWNPISWEDCQVDILLGYCASKKFAEQAAWDFVEREKPSYTFNVVLPSYVFGPGAFDSEVNGEFNLSSALIKGLVESGPEAAVPEMEGIFIDVRDVAKAHLAAFEKGFSNKRLLLNSSAFTSQDILRVLKNNFESLDGKLPAGTPGDFLKHSPFGSVDTKNTAELLGFSFIDLKTSVVDSVSQVFRTKSE